ncbi:hypothetical protein MASR2M39_17640 [Ignavibacteriales bacterium]
MLITLLIFNFLVALLTCGIIAYFFKKPLDTIFQRLVKEDIYIAWSRYILFAIFVVGISGGVRIWELEKYLNTNEKTGAYIYTLTAERWAIEIYRAIMGTLEATAWMLLFVFLFALVAYVVIRLTEAAQENKEKQFRAFMDDKRNEKA